MQKKSALFWDRDPVCPKERIARVASSRLTGSTPNGAPLYETVEVIDGHVVKLASKPPLKSLLSTPQLPENLAAHLPSDPAAPDANALP